MIIIQRVAAQAAALHATLWNLRDNVEKQNYWQRYGRMAQNVAIGGGVISLFLLGFELNY